MNRAYATLDAPYVNRVQLFASASVRDNSIGTRMKVQFPKDFKLEGTSLWTSPLAPSIAYSEGSDAENYLVKVLERANDLSSTSIELEKQIVDWSSEYHLSPQRSNLLRPFKLKRK